MNCEEVKRLLKKEARITRPEIADHLKTCPSCSRAAESTQLLKRLFNNAKNAENQTATPFEKLRFVVEDSMAGRNPKEKIMSQVRTQLSNRPKLVFGLGLAVMAFLFVTLVPFSYTRTIGYEMTISGLGKDLSFDKEKILETLSALGFENVSVHRSINGGIKFDDMPNRNVAQEISAAFSIMTGKIYKPEINPIIEVVSGSLYAQVVHKYDIEVETTGKTEAEIAEEIRQKLNAQGIMNPDVQVTSNGDERTVNVKIESNDGDQQSVNVIELKISGGDTISFQAPTKSERLDIDTEGKTAAEIKAEVEARLAAEGKGDANVEVIEHEDGRFEINISIEREEIR